MGKFIPAKVVSRHAPPMRPPSENLLRHAFVSDADINDIICRPRHDRRHSIELPYDFCDARFVILERLLFGGALGLWGDFEALFGRVQDVLDLLEQAFVLLELGIGLHCLLDQQLDVAELAEVEVAFAL
jgi:hypothetical protein